MLSRFTTISPSPVAVIASSPREHGTLARAHGSRVLAHRADTRAFALEQPALTRLRERHRGASVFRKELPCACGGQSHLRQALAERLSLIHISEPTRQAE